MPLQQHCGWISRCSLTFSGQQYKSIIVNWNRVQELMKIYTEGKPLPFSKIDLRLIDSFKTFLLTAPQGGGKSGIISQNTASTYFSIFKAELYIKRLLTVILMLTLLQK